MSDSRNDMMISEMSEMANSNHELLKKMNSFLSTIPNDSIEKDTYGETIEQDLENVLDNLKRITKMKDNLLFSRTTLNLGQIKKLDEIENLEKDSSNKVYNIEYKIKKNKIVNNAIMGTLEDLARDTVMEHNIPPENVMQRSVLYKEYGGFRNRKNKTKNKKYTKKRTHKRPKKRVSKKNKTRKMKKNYL
jgi:hypothetical protein